MEEEEKPFGQVVLCIFVSCFEILFVMQVLQFSEMYDFAALLALRSSG